MMTLRTICLLCLVAVACAMGGCRDRGGAQGGATVADDHGHSHAEGDHDHDHSDHDHDHEVDDGHDHGEDASAADHGHDHAGEVDGVGVDIPAAVRQNLSLTFVEAELRRVEQTLRVPGRFEYLPTARREYRTMLAGRVELAVEQYQRVEAGTLLYRIDSPSWRALQQQISDEEAAIERLGTRLASYGPLRTAHRHHEEQLREIVAIRRERIAQLEELSEAGGGRAGQLNEARGAVASAEADLAEILEKEAELAADESEARAELAASRTRREFLLDSAASLLGASVDDLTREVDGRPMWRSVGLIVVKAEEPGVVESLGVTRGAWADEKAAVVTVVQPERLRFRAMGLQSDLGVLRDGLPARIVAPTPTRASGSVDFTSTMEGRLLLGLSGDPDDRTLELLVVPDVLQSWARPGVSAQLEVVTDMTTAPAVAIPRAAVQRDGLMPVYFVRDPDDPDRAVRVEADLGLDDGRWVVVKRGLQVGNEVVLDGAFQLMLATATGGTTEQGGHFHSDGTFHAEEHD
ncbi:MAG: hypothetical protein KDA21_05155 [Phycisphaerales bacterium]|nr:hypothetical protein [Phycisphaerales bacterium]